MAVEQTGSVRMVPLGSGSRGNACYLETNSTKVLIDAGLSGRQIKLRLEQIGVDVEDLDGVVITHEHSDHIQGLKILGGKMGLPVLCNSETARGIIGNLGLKASYKIFTTGETFQFQDLEIHPFSIQHDAADPVGFTVKVQGYKMGFCTDLGFASTLVSSHLKACDYLLLESNHDPELVQMCPRPFVYKQRVLGRAGHLSNQACGDLLAEITHPGLKHVYLAHLSQECNRESLALETVRAALQEAVHIPEMTVAPQDVPCVPQSVESL